MASGRPTKYDPKYCDMLVKHMAKGFSFESFAGVVKTCIQTLYTWSKEHREFLDAKAEGHAQGMRFWEDAGIEGMWNEKEGRTLNASVWIFNMKNRYQWRDKQEIEAKIDYEREKIRNMSTAELKEFIRKREEESANT